MNQNCSCSCLWKLSVWWKPWVRKQWQLLSGPNSINLSQFHSISCRENKENCGMDRPLCEFPQPRYQEMSTKRDIRDRGAALRHRRNPYRISGKQIIDVVVYPFVTVRFPDVTTICGLWFPINDTKTSHFECCITSMQSLPTPPIKKLPWRPDCETPGRKNVEES